jgi:hypothetical protein
MISEDLTGFLGINVWIVCVGRARLVVALNLWSRMYLYLWLQMQWSVEARLNGTLLASCRPGIDSNHLDSIQLWGIKSRGGNARDRCVCGFCVVPTSTQGNYYCREKRSIAFMFFFLKQVGSLHGVMNTRSFQKISYYRSKCVCQCVRSQSRYSGETNQSVA